MSAQDQIAKLDVFGSATRGARDEQQDSFKICFLESEAAWLLVIADGMGGYRGGSVASSTAAKVFAENFVVLHRNGSEQKVAMSTALTQANKAIADAKAGRKDLSEMGTTLTAVYISARGISWISVGDSPVWLYRSGQLQRLNADHSLRDFIESPSDSRRNMLRSALTGEEMSLIDSGSEHCDMSDAMVLAASDGVLTLDETQILKIFADCGFCSSKLMVWLLQNAVVDRARPHQDNCTIVVASPLSDPENQGPRRKSTGSWFAAARCLLGI